LNWSDFIARFYGGIIPTFLTMDPLAEKDYSVRPYAYCRNNPARYVDKDGRKIQISNSYAVAMNNIARIAATSYGRAVLNRLIESNETYKLKSIFWTSDSSYDPSSKTIKYVGDPWKNTIAGAANTSMTAMGHETYHAYEDSYGIGRDEPGAVSFANYLRRTYSLFPLRDQNILNGLPIKNANFQQFGIDEKISDFTVLGKNADKTNYGFSYTKTTTIVESYKEEFGIMVPDKTTTMSSTYYMTVNMDKNKNATYKIYNNEEEYKEAINKW